MEALSKNKQKWVRSLRLKKNRDKENCFIVEGKKLVLEIVNNHSDLIELVCTTEEGNTNNCYLVSDVEMKNMTSFTTPSSHLAVVRKPNIQVQSNELTVVIDGVQDPGNMGTIIRTCDWFGVNKIVCSLESVDCFNPKVIQSSMGSIFRVAIEYKDLSSYLDGVSSTIYGAVMDGDNINSITKIPANSILVVGNEGNGISEPVMDRITQTVSIPGKGGAESLNVSVATGILLSHFSHHVAR